MPNYIKDAKARLEANDINGALAILLTGLKAQDKKSLMAVYYLPKYDEIKWQEKCAYLEKYFYQFELDITFDEFLSQTGIMGHGDLFRQCAFEVGVSPDELKSEIYYNWCLINKYKVSKKEVDAFWERFADTYLKDTLLKMLTNLEQFDI